MKATKRLARLTLALAAAAVMAGFAAAGAVASEGPFHLDSDQYKIESFSTSTSTSTAGARVDFGNVFELKSGEVGGGYIKTYGRSKLFEIDLPQGLVGDPTEVPTCPLSVFYKTLPFEACPVETSVGYATLDVPGYSVFDGPVFNLEPRPDEPALFGIKPDISLYTFIHIRVSSDGELTAVIDENPLGSPVRISDVEMWGVPADHGAPGDRVPFMTNPTNCSEPFASKLDAFSYEEKSDSADFTEPARTNCADVPFAPSMTVTPTSREAGSPTGIDVNLKVPQHEGPDDIATAHVKDVRMTFPEGMSVSSSAANGLGSCSPQEFGYHEETPITCPQSSKIGTVTVKTPILEKPLSGPVYVAKQNDNPFNSLLALYMAPEGSGVHLKLAGKVDLDPASGRLTTTFINNPQQPFEELTVSLKDGPRAPLALPRACGTYNTSAELSSWARPGEAVPLSSSFTLDQGCGRENQFTPGFSAGTMNPGAGAFSPFTMRVTRSDAQQNISAIDVSLPEGLSAKLAGVPLCGEAAAATGNCPASSQVGSATVGAGAGSSPVYVPQPGRPPTAVYLAGPYKGGPYSIVAKVPAQAGPFDLGTVSVRSAIQVDPATAQVSVKSDPLPQILQGVPVAYRDIRVDVDRPGFTLNSTSCEQTAVNATIASAQGKSANVSAPFKASSCAKLAFKPKLALSLKGGTKRGSFPKLKAVLTQPKGQANIGRVTVALPHSEFLAQEHIKTICTRVQYAADACPAGSIYGRARAITPLLDQPLEGPVYLRSSNNPLPDLVVALHGQIDIDLAGKIDSVDGGIRNTFSVVPDAPVSKFVLEMQGGKKSLLVNSRNLCRSTSRAQVKMEGHNGKTRDFTPLLTNSCGKKAKK